MKKLIALYLILLPLWAFAQQTFVPVSATMTDAEGSYTSKNFDAPNLQFWDNQSSITVKWGDDRLSLQKQVQPTTLIAPQFPLMACPLLSPLIVAQIAVKYI